MSKDTFANLKTNFGIHSMGLPMFLPNDNDLIIIANQKDLRTCLQKQSDIPVITNPINANINSSTQQNTFNKDIKNMTELFTAKIKRN